MFDHSRLAEILAAYKQNFVSRLTGKDEEIFKWKAVKCFQDHWNVNDRDFARMLEQSLSETSILLRSANKFPARWIVELAKQVPEEVRGMFIALFDQSKDVFERIKAFKQRSVYLLKQYGKGEKYHFQTENAITTYLWLRYPDNYYIYQFTVAQEVAKRLKADTDGGFKQGAYTENLRNFLKLYDELNAALKEDSELVRLLESQLTDTCYPDPQLKTLTVDVGYYIGKRKDAAAESNDQGEGDDNGEDDHETAGQYTSDESAGDTAPPPYDVYTKTDFLDEVYMSEERYDSLAAVLKNKKNIILQGAPGVGKTFAARRLAWSMMGEKDNNRIAFVQFHQNYSYEDFMMGYKPVEDGFKLRRGIFYRFCQKAAKRPDKDFFFIIDEINRGNMSKIFGELLMLIEKDHRDEKVTLAYNGRSFSVPKNLYIIGMMNTADRSLAMIDYALRRRFSFFDLEPGFESDGFLKYKNALNNDTLNELISKVEDLNREIAQDKSLGKGFCIGHSYFCGQKVCTEEWLRSIVDYDIIPMLREYWFDEPNKLQLWENNLQGLFQR